MKRAVHSALATLLLLALIPIVPASAEGASRVGTGPTGQRLTVSQVSGLAGGGQTLTVSGTGYDVRKGIYLAFCVHPAVGQTPSPCGGGADTSGATGSSVWISSNPPSYGQDLARPYGAGGTFTAKLYVSAQLDDGHDCHKITCGVATRNDHTRSTDRSQDVVVDLAFAQTQSPGPTYWLWTPLTLAVIVAGLGFWLVRRRRATEVPGE